MSPSLTVHDSPKIQVVACSFRIDPEAFARRLSSLLDKFRVAHAGVIASSVITENRAFDERWTTLNVPNDDLDFSAYFAGARLLSETYKSEVTLFVNDTLFTNHAAHANLRAVLRLLPLMDQVPIPAISGKCDSYTTVCLRNPWSGLTKYVSTYCFLLNGPGLRTFLTLPTLAESDGVTLHGDVESPMWGRNLPAAFREFIRANLVYRESPYLWYRFNENKLNQRIILSKARCIYFEHRLSGVIGTTGCLLPSNAGPRWEAYLSLHEMVRRLQRKLFMSSRVFRKVS